MVLGAVRAGKLAPDDPRIPQSVKQVIQDMKNKGIDPTKADTKEIQKYLKDNPKALEAAKKEIRKDSAAAAPLDDQQLTKTVKAQANQAAAAANTRPPNTIVSKTL
jgi:hypothetical protein